MECPECGEPTFGVLAIDGHRYWRRCKNCLHPRGKQGIAFPLPSLERKVVYLDQFAISLMMKSLHLDWASRQATAQSILWRELFEHLDSAWRLNLIVCPTSSFHWSESNATKHHIELQQLYQHFACDCHFHTPDEIRLAQLYHHVKAWLADGSKDDLPLQHKDALNGDPSAWYDVLHIDVAFDRCLEFQQQRRRDRENAHVGFQDTFDAWRDKATSFEDTYRRELAGFGIVLLKNWNENFTRTSQILSGNRIPTLDDAFIPLVTRTAEYVLDIVSREVSDVSYAVEKTVAYFGSADFSGVPTARISSLLLACLSQRAAKGGQRKIGRGMINDIKMVSSLLPYCDAMFIDREMHGLLKEKDVETRIGFPTKLFSAANLPDFFMYLDTLRDSATSEHVQCVREVYGDDWLKPYAGIYR